MIVNQAALRGIYVNFNTIFNKVFENESPLYPMVATKIPSTTGEEAYKWLGKIPSMREWVGARQIQNIEASDYTIKNKDFELTVGVSKNDIEDDKIGIYSPIIQSLAESTARFPDDLVFELLRNGFTNKCYDGKAFFADDHKVGKLTFSNKSAAKLSPTSYAAARAAIMSVTDEHGKSLNLVPNVLVVPPALEGEARKILLADQIDATSNIYKGTAEPLIVPTLAGSPKAWYLLCTTKALKPLIYQERKAPVFTSKDKDTDDNVFFQKEFIYGADSRANAGYGFWQMAYGSTGTEV